LVIQANIIFENKMDENLLRQKLRKIETLFAGTTNGGEQQAAQSAMLRIKSQLDQAANKMKIVEFRFSLDNRWSRKLFIALCRRYDLTPYRYYRQRNTTVMLKAPECFVNTILYPEFVALNKELQKYFDDQIENIIKEEIHADTTDAKETLVLEGI
jgi:hypothetical protein